MDLLKLKKPNKLKNWLISQQMLLCSNNNIETYKYVLRYKTIFSYEDFKQKKNEILPFIYQKKSQMDLFGRCS